jgi:F-type H+-transporting ATPase subunit a
VEAHDVNTILAQGEPFHVPSVIELFEFVPLATFTLAGVEFEVTFPILILYAITFGLAALFLIGFGRAQVVPSGVQNVLEAGVDLIRKEIVQPTIGAGGEKWIPFLCSLFFFIFFLNLMGITPIVMFPVTSRMAIPAFLAVLVLVIFNVVGMKEQGPLKYWKNLMFPPGVPAPVYIILTPVEIGSKIIFRPLTLAVRLFANMMAGHTLVAIFTLATGYFLYRGGGLLPVLSPFPLVMSVGIMAFELLISTIQAFIFTILAAVYIGEAVHPEH